MREQTKYCIALSLATIVGFLAITHQSFWIDEGVAALKAMQPNIHGWWQSLRKDSDSNLQLIFQLFYLWGWEKIFGSAEYALRASNIPWFVVATVALMWSFPKNGRLQLSVLLLTLTSAFLWYYLSEARPYIVLFAFAAATTACLLRMVGEESSVDSSTWFRVFCLGSAGLCATSLIAVPWALGAMLATGYWLGINRTRKLLLRFRYSTLITAAVILIVGAYYAWTLHLGARASGVNRTSAGSVLFIIYELSGLSGLGPGRLELREFEFGAFRHGIPILLIGLCAISGLFLASVGVAVRKVNRRSAIFFVIAVAIPFLLAIIAGFLGHMRLLGRHLTPLLPFLLAFLALGLQRLLFDQRIIFKLAGLVSILVCLFSDWEIRFAPRHRRDDYRSAVETVRKAVVAGKNVWWTAEPSLAEYYHAPLNSKDFIVTSNASEDELAMATVPDLVCLSKPDIYDQNAVVRHYLQRHRFKVVETFPAFQIFEPAGGGLESPSGR